MLLACSVIKKRKEKQNKNKILSLNDTPALSFSLAFLSPEQQSRVVFIDWKSRCYTTWQTEQINLWKRSSCLDSGRRISDAMSQQFFTICIYSVDASDGESACFMYACIINSMQMLRGHNVALLSWQISYPDALKHFSYKPHGRMVLFSFNSWGFSLQAKVHSGSVSFALPSLS